MRNPESKYYYPFTGEQLDLIAFAVEYQVEEMNEYLEYGQGDASAILFRKAKFTELLEYINPKEEEDYYSEECLECGKLLRGKQEDYCSAVCHEASMR